MTWLAQPDGASVLQEALQTQRYIGGLTTTRFTGGYIIEEDGARFYGIVCAQGRNPYSTEGVIEKVLLAANGIGDAIEEFESYCFANAYQIR